MVRETEKLLLQFSGWLQINADIHYHTSRRGQEPRVDSKSWWFIYVESENEACNKPEEQPEQLEEPPLNLHKFIFDFAHQSSKPLTLATEEEEDVANYPLL